MYNLSVAKVQGPTSASDRPFNAKLTGTLPRFDLTAGGNVFVKRFDPHSYNSRHSDTERILSSGSYTSQYYVETKEMVMALDVYGTREYIHETFARVFAQGQQLALMWWGTPDGAASHEAHTSVPSPHFPYYIYCKPVGVSMPTLPGQSPIDASNSHAIMNIRLRANDPFIYSTDTRGGGLGSVLNSGNKTPNANVASSLSHTPQYLDFIWRNPAHDVTVAHTLTNTTTNTSTTLTIETNDTGATYRYNLWQNWGRDIKALYRPAGTSSSVVDFSIWDGNFLEFAPGDNSLVYTVDPEVDDVTDNNGDVTETHWGIYTIGREPLFL